MKRSQVARLSVLVIGFAISAPKVTAQLVPIPDPPSVNVATVGTSRPLYQSPISAYVRPSERKKLQLFVFDAVGPYAFVKATLAGGYDQETKSPPEWGSGWDAYGSRVASNFGIQLVTATTRYGMAEILHEDPAYYRCKCGGLFPRIGHALVSTVMARRGEAGYSAFSLSGLASPYAGTMAALAWYPDRYGVKDGFRMGNYNLAWQAVGNLALEFIYGGPHTLFSHLAHSNRPGGTAAQNP